MAKNEHTVIRSACFASASVVVLYWALVMPAAAINLLNPDIEPNEKAMIWAAFKAMPTYAGVLLMSGIVAAALSSASTFLSLIGCSATNDIVELRVGDEQRKLRMTLLHFGHRDRHIDRGLFPTTGDHDDQLLCGDAVLIVVGSGRVYRSRL